MVTRLLEKDAADIRFDGDGMLHGVYFPDDNNDASHRAHTGPSRRAIYTNRHLATPLLDLTLLLLRSPIPSIALLISPLSSLHRIISAIIQAFTIAIRARLGVLSVANTSVIWWATGLGTEAEEEKGIEDDLGLGEVEGDGRLLATCESGPPLEVRVPGLETVRWDRLEDVDGESLGNRRGKWEWFKRWGLSRVQEVGLSLSPSPLFFFSCLPFSFMGYINQVIVNLEPGGVSKVADIRTG